MGISRIVTINSKVQKSPKICLPISPELDILKCPFLYIFGSFEIQIFAFLYF